MTADFVLARLKFVAALVGFLATSASVLDWGVPIPAWVTALASLLTAFAVYAVPNVTAEGAGGTSDPAEDDLDDDPRPRRELAEDEGYPPFPPA